MCFCNFIYHGMNIIKDSYKEHCLISTSVNLPLSKASAADWCWGLSLHRNLSIKRRKESSQTSCWVFFGKMDTSEWRHNAYIFFQLVFFPYPSVPSYSNPPSCSCLSFSFSSPHTLALFPNDIRCKTCMTASYLESCLHFIHPTPTMQR